MLVCFLDSTKQVCSFTSHQHGVCVAIDRKYKAHVADMWGMFRQESQYSIYSPTLSGHLDANWHVQ